MKSKSRIEIMTETTREVTLRFERRPERRSFFNETCGACRGTLVAINEAVQLSGLAWDEIIRRIKNDTIHSTETAKGEIYVCATSLVIEESKKD